MTNLAEHIFVLKRESVLAGILAVTVMVDVPGCYLSCIRRLRGKGPSPIMVVPALAYVWIGLYSKAPLVFGPINTQLGAVAARLLDVVVLITWHCLFVSFIPILIVKIVKHREERMKKGAS